MSKYLCVALFSMIFLFAATEKSFACSCLVTPEPQKKQVQNAYSGANAIFSGEVIEIKESPTSKIDLIVKFKIAKSWKGAADREITVSTAKDSAMCGFNFETGKNYIVYAFGANDGFSTTNCSRTALFDQKKSDAKYLDKLKKRERKS